MLAFIKKIDREIDGKPTPAKVYKNTLTNSEVVVYWLRRDISGNDWWTFEDLYTLPFIRQLAAKKVLDLYGNGLALEDVKSISSQLKTILRTKTEDKYELAFAKVLELENLAETMADPVKQCIGLCTVYLLMNDEPPDSWTNQMTAAKMTALTLDIDSQSFFLNWWIGIMERSGKVLKGLSQIVSKTATLSESTIQEQSN